MALPVLFNGVKDPLALFALATLSRCCYSYTNRRRDFFNRAYGLEDNWYQYTLPGAGTQPKYTVLTAPDHFIVVINGTEAVNQVMQYIANSHSRPIDVDHPDVRVLDQFGTWAEIMRQSLITNGYWGVKPMLIVGHSMGGAIAHILQWQAAKLAGGPTRSCAVSFGSPRAGNSKLGLLGWDHLSVRVVNGLDLITNLPPEGTVITDLRTLAQRGTDWGFMHRHGVLWLNPECVGGNLERLRTLGDSIGATSRGGSSDLFKDYHGRPPPLNVGTLNWAGTCHLIRNYAIWLRLIIKHAPDMWARCLDLLNIGLNQQESAPPWLDTPIGTIDWERGVRRTSTYLPTDPDWDLSGTASGGDWAAQADVMIARPPMSARPGFVPPTSSPTDPVQQELWLRRRRRF